MVQESLAQPLSMPARECSMLTGCYNRGNGIGLPLRQQLSWNWSHMLQTAQSIAPVALLQSF